jgi:hypothetical protein
MTTPLEVVQRQLDAYNQHDLERFLESFSDGVKTYRMPALEPSVTSKAMLRDFYATQRFNRPGLHAELVSRTVIGNKVFDHERIHGLGEAPLETMAVFEVVDGLIQTCWFFAA